MSTPTTDEGLRVAQGGVIRDLWRVHGTLEPEGLTSTPTTMWVLIIYPTGNNDTR